MSIRHIHIDILIKQIHIMNNLKFSVTLNNVINKFILNILSKISD